MRVPNHQPAVLHRLVYELRYDGGFVYLDKCGQTLNRLLRERPDWEVPDPNRGTMTQIQSNKVFSFGSTKLDLSQAQNVQVDKVGPIEDFAADADRLSSIVIEELGLQEFSRIGVRVWHLFGTKSFDDACSIVLALAPLDPDPLAGLVGGQPSEGSFALRVERDKANWRVAVAPVEQNVSPDPTALRRLAKMRAYKRPDQKKALREKLLADKALKALPPVAVLVDIDAYMEDPPIGGDVKIADFISEQLAEIQAKASRICGLTRR